VITLVEGYYTVKKILSWLIGLSIGAAIGAVIIMIFVPETGEQITNRIKEGFEGAMEEARKAAATRRKELEEELATIQKERDGA